METLSILSHFEARFGAQMEQVLELQGFECESGGSFGVLESGKSEVSREQIDGLRGFFGECKVSK